jgi:hypothetical protein
VCGGGRRWTDTNSREKLLAGCTDSFSTTSGSGRFCRRCSSSCASTSWTTQPETVIWQRLKYVECARVRVGPVVRSHSVFRQSERQSRLKFDPSWLVDLLESVQLEVLAGRVTPLVSNPGRLVVTSKRIYFQPFNNVDPDPVLKFSLASLQRANRRRYMLRQVGLELFFEDKSCIYFSFANRTERDRVFDVLRTETGARLDETNLERATIDWQVGAHAQRQRANSRALTQGRRPGA